MSEFSYKDYEQAMNVAKNREASNSNKSSETQIKFFKLAGDGAEAIARFNLETLDDLKFASVHKAIYGKKFDGLSNPYAGVSCLNTFGSKEKICPFCEAVVKGHDVIDKAAKKVYLTMIVRYIDRDTNKLSEPEYVVWERPAGFYKELALFLKNGKGLKNKLLIVSRIDNPRTSYRIIPADQDIYPNDIIPTDFTPFESLKMDHFAYKNKSLEDMNAFIADGVFPAVVYNNQTAGETKVESTQTKVETQVQTPKVETTVDSVPETKPSEVQTVEPTEEPKRNFNWSW